MSSGIDFGNKYPLKQKFLFSKFLFVNQITLSSFGVRQKYSSMEINLIRNNLLISVNLAWSSRRGKLSELRNWLQVPRESIWWPSGNKPSVIFLRRSPIYQSLRRSVRQKNIAGDVFLCIQCDNNKAL